MVQETRAARPQLPYRSHSSRRLPPWEIELIVRMYEEGVPVAFIAEAARVSAGTVYIYLREARAALAGWDGLLGISDA